MEQKEIKLSRKWRLFRKSIKLIYEKQPKLLLCHSLLSITGVLFAYPEIFLYSALLDSLLGGELLRLIALALTLTGYLFLTRFLTGLGQKALDVEEKRFLFKQKLFLADCAMEMDYETLGSQEIREKIEAVSGCTQQTGARLQWAVVYLDRWMESLLGMVTAAVALVLWLLGVFPKMSKSGLLLFLGGAAVMLLVDILSLLMTARREKKRAEFEKATYPLYTIYRYLDHHYLILTHAAKEVRVFSQDRIIKRLLRETDEKLLQTTARERKCNLRLDAVTRGASLLNSGAAAVSVGQLVVRGLLTVGEYSGVYSLLLRWNQAFLQFLRSLPESRPLFRFLDLFWDFCDRAALPSPAVSAALPPADAPLSDPLVEAENLSFAYENGGFHLQNVSFTVRQGEHIAIVGQNGSGKSTLIMLLCGLYKPAGGSLRIAGESMPAGDVKAHWQRLGTVFQKFQLLALPLGENIAASCRYDQEKVTAAMAQAGMAPRFFEMLDCYVTRRLEESGIDLSGGESQKAAIARAVCRDAPLLIMDEPTAALDPIAESGIYEAIHTHFRDKTVFFISHRLSSCRFCDRILVMDKGRLVQQGSHEELLADPAGKYAALWHAQAKYYEEEKALGRCGALT